MEKFKVLLVDDEVEFVSALAERFALRGLEARTAFNGNEAMRLIEEDAPQAVVLDLMMPGLGGKETLQLIRSRYPEIKVILLTGHGSTQDAEEGIRLGAYDYLAKPINIEELLAKIREALKPPDKR